MTHNESPVPFLCFQVEIGILPEGFVLNSTQSCMKRFQRWPSIGFGNMTVRRPRAESKENSVMEDPTKKFVALFEEYAPNIPHPWTLIFILGVSSPVSSLIS